MTKPSTAKEDSNLNPVGSQNSPHELRGSFGVIVNTELSRMSEILELLHGVRGTRIVYYRVSPGKLFIVPEDEYCPEYDGGNPRRRP